MFIDPGSPWQNAWIESINGRLRDEPLNMWQFDSLLGAQVVIEDHRIDYDNQRPHSADPCRLRRQLDHQPTQSCIATGTDNGALSAASFSASIRTASEPGQATLAL